MIFNVGSGDLINKINNSLNYSAEETVIGTWNGKTHYRKVYFLDIDVKTNAGEVNCIFRETCATVPMERSAVPL